MESNSKSKLLDIVFSDNPFLEYSDYLKSAPQYNHKLIAEDFIHLLTSKLGEYYNKLADNLDPEIKEHHYIGVDENDVMAHDIVKDNALQEWYRNNEWEHQKILKHAKNILTVEPSSINAELEENDKVLKLGAPEKLILIILLQELKCFPSTEGKIDQKKMHSFIASLTDSNIETVKKAFGRANEVIAVRNPTSGEIKARSKSLTKLKKIVDLIKNEPLSERLDQLIWKYESMDVN